MNPRIRIELVDNGFIVDVHDETGRNQGTEVYSDVDEMLDGIRGMIEVVED